MLCKYVLDFTLGLLTSCWCYCVHKGDQFCRFYGFVVNPKWLAVLANTTFLSLNISCMQYASWIEALPTLIGCHCYQHLGLWVDNDILLMVGLTIS